jgi:hypothetical protein
MDVQNNPADDLKEVAPKAPVEEPKPNMDSRYQTPSSFQFDQNDISSPEDSPHEDSEKNNNEASEKKSKSKSTPQKAASPRIIHW